MKRHFFHTAKSILAAGALAAAVALGSKANPYPVFVPKVAADDVQWDFKTAGRIVAIGDVHGAFKELVVILHDQGLIDRDLNWTGGDSHLVLLGDLFNGGDVNKDSRLIMDLLIRLDAQAREQGGRVHVTLGNHDLQVLAGRLDKMEKSERKKYKEYAIGGMFYDKTRDAIRHSPFGEFLGRQNQIVGINDHFFVHAGVNPRVLRESGLSIAQVNTVVRNHIRSWRLLDHGFTVGVGLPEFVNFEGASWFGGFKLHDMEEGRRRDPSAPTIEEFDTLLAGNGKKGVVAGHRGTPDREIVLVDPYYGTRYISADTGIGFRKSGGRLSALEIRPNGEMKAHYPVYNKELADALKERAMARLVRRGTKLACSALFN